MMRLMTLPLLAAILSLGGLASAGDSYDAQRRAENRQVRLDRSRGTSVRIRQPRPRPRPVVKPAPLPRVKGKLSLDRLRLKVAAQKS